MLYLTLPWFTLCSNVFCGGFSLTDDPGDCDMKTLLLSVFEQIIIAMIFMLNKSSSVHYHVKENVYTVLFLLRRDILSCKCFVGGGFY